MSIPVINSNAPVSSTQVAASKPIDPNDVTAFQSLLSEGATPSMAANQANGAATLADFYKQVQFDVVNMCVQYTPTFRD